jgi:hypothetical protein
MPDYVCKNVCILNQCFITYKIIIDFNNVVLPWLN